MYPSTYRVGVSHTFVRVPLGVCRDNERRALAVDDKDISHFYYLVPSPVIPSLEQNREHRFHSWKRWQRHHPPQLVGQRWVPPLQAMF